MTQEKTRLFLNSIFNVKKNFTQRNNFNSFVIMYIYFNQLDINLEVKGFWHKVQCLQLYFPQLVHSRNYHE